MQITKQEVKTTYDIRFTFAEFLEIARAYNNSMDKNRHPLGFENISLEKLLDSETTAEWAFKQLFLKGTGDTYQLIANHFGFEGCPTADTTARHRSAIVCRCITTEIRCKREVPCIIHNQEVNNNGKENNLLS